MSQAQALEIIDIVRLEIEQAADAMLAAAERGLRDVTAIRAKQSDAVDHVEQMFLAILEACAFQDLAGQRLTKLRGLVGVLPTTASATADPLLNGPATPGAGLEQAAIDQLMRGGKSPDSP